MSAFVRVYLI